MRILYYAAPGNEEGDKLGRTVKTSFPEAEVEHHTTVEVFAERLLQKIDAKTVAFVRADSEQDLIDLYYIQHLLRKVLFVLLLPDRERLTIAMGHRLHPSYMCFADGEQSEIVAALTSILRSGYAPKPAEEASKNPFEAVVPPSHAEDQHGSWMFAAA